MSFAFAWHLILDWIRSYQLVLFSCQSECIWNRNVPGLDNSQLRLCLSSLNQIRLCISIAKQVSNSHLHISAKACCLWTWVRWLASCCCWCASVCFIRTIRILCSIAYFLAFVTVSHWSEFNRGKVPPKIPRTADRVPGPKTTSPVCLML